MYLRMAVFSPLLLRGRHAERGRLEGGERLGAELVGDARIARRELRLSGGVADLVAEEARGRVPRPRAGLVHRIAEGLRLDDRRALRLERVGERHVVLGEARRRLRRLV